MIYPKRNRKGRVTDHLHFKQKGKCAICGRGDRRALALDHNHRTLVIRELLCLKCNMALGLIGESEAVAFAMAAYIRKHKKVKEPW